jgi:ribose/xylose/arabinose/galactoside ABC-type transport system permease subunit
MSEAIPASASGSTGRRLFELIARFGFLGVLIVMFIGLSITTRSFFTLDNQMGLLHAIAPSVIISCGMALVVMSGKLDISVGSIAFLSTALGSLLIKEAGWNPLPAYAVTLIVGAVLGAVNGFIVVVLRVNALITTLGTMIAFRGLALQVTNANVIVLPDEVRQFGNLSVGPVFVDILVAAAVLIAIDLLHQRSSFGRQITAIGNSEAIASRIGLPVARLTFLTFVLCGVLAALGGIFSAAQVGSVTTFLGQGLEFTAVAIVVVGGISLFGGRGRILSGVALGALTFEMIRNGLNHLGANPYSYKLVGGVVIFIAMYADALKARLRKNPGGG